MHTAAATEKHSPPVVSGNPYWTADGLPLGHGNVMGESLHQAQWDSSLFACLGRNDEFCSSDLEVCFVDLVIKFDLKVTLLKGLRQELTSMYLLHIDIYIYIYTRMYTITYVDEVKGEPTENP
ncbi:Cell number regulator 8 [Camellia lanceoleosa]|nr:Cell number regulator 8 [Camellia lanceoleosa]